MCSESIADEHQHVVNVAGRQLMCVCRGCYLLFTDSHAELRYRAVPDRYLAFPDFALDRRAWEALQIPVGVAFFFRNSALGRTVAFYPGPAGASESELDLDAWNAISGADPRVGLLADDVEALLVRVPDDDDGEFAQPQSYLVPDRRLLRVRRSVADAVARFRRRPSRRASSSTTSSRRSRPEPGRHPWGRRHERPAAGRDLHRPGRGARAVRGDPGAHRPRRRRRQWTTRCTRSRCAARSASSRCDAPTPTRKRPG